MPGFLTRSEVHHDSCSTSDGLLGSSGSDVSHFKSGSITLYRQQMLPYREQ